MQDAVLGSVIFSPGRLAITLADGLNDLGLNVKLYSPGAVSSSATNVTADLSYFERELALRGDSYTTLMKKHPLTFVSLARQVQAEIIAKAFADANADNIDVVHIYTNEEDIALPFAQFCKKPVVFTHHDPFSLLVRYKNNFPKYGHLNWIALSESQKSAMPAGTNWVGTIYHGLPRNEYAANYHPKGDYVLFMGRIVQPKGTHLAIKAVQNYNRNLRAGQSKLRLKIVGRHYAGESKDTYWQEHVQPYIEDEEIEHVGFVNTVAEKQELLGNARALIMPSLFDEPFGMVAIEAMACATPVVSLDRGALPELIMNGINGTVVPAIESGGQVDESATAQGLSEAIAHVGEIDRYACRAEFEARFTAERMCREYQEVFARLVVATESPKE